MILGLRRGTVDVEPHRKEWESTAKETIEQLNMLLKDIAVDIQHIGSTAIHNIYAKPIIDIVVGVPELENILSMNNCLEKNGFIFRGQDIPNQYLYICGENDFRTHHIHAVKYDSEAWNNYINLRDYLNCHDADAQAYSKLKQSLAKIYYNDRETYTAKKSVFINEILIKAKEWNKLISIDNSPNSLDINE
ncbi:MAG: GrpB family protein [Ruminococcus sp.]|nr:GrpB family protein [Ruminococcus sp.]